MVSRDRQASLLESVGANVRTARLRRGLTQEQLAELADLSTVHLQRIERGQVDLRISALVALVDALGVRVTDVLRRRTVLPERKAGRPPTRRSIS